MTNLPGELGSTIPWLYRGWLFLLIPAYRRQRRHIWQQKGARYRQLDSIGTLIFTTAEVIALVAIFSTNPYPF